MKIVRPNVFETNSSSSHSLSIRKGKLEKSNLRVSSVDNKVHVEFGEFGWEVETYDSQEDKLSYLCTMLIETEGRKLNKVEDFYETKGYLAINEAISSYCNCKGICIDSNIELMSYPRSDGSTYFYLSHDGYIDHQSHEDYSSVQEFLDDYSTDIINFVFNDGVSVRTDNDNH